MHNNKSGKGVFYFTLAFILSVILTPIGLIYGLIKSFYKFQFISALKSIDTKLYNISCIIDLLGNIICFELFNDILITKQSKHLFGKRNEQMSVIQKRNQEDKTLTAIGEWLTQQLQKINTHE